MIIVHRFGGNITMKKITLFLMMFLIIFVLACQGSPSTTQGETTTVSSTSDDPSTETSTQTTTNATNTTRTVTTTDSGEIQSCEERGLDMCAFRLSEALPDGSFDFLASFDDLSDAQQILNERTDPNLVVIDDDETVLDMKYGAVNFKTKSISEITTIGHVNFPHPTYVNGHYNVDGVYLGAEGTIVYGMIAGVRFEVVNSEIELIPDAHLNDSYSYYEIADGELVHRITYNLRTSSYGSIGAIDIAPGYLETGVRYYSYDNHYFYTDFRQMTDDLKNGTYEHAVNAESPYYNYYQYLSFRSKTNYTAEELNTYISANVGTTSGIYDTGEDFINAQNEVYVNAAMELAFAIHESGWGSSRIARDKNNLFGINAYDSDPYGSATSFDTVQDCIEYHVQHFLGTRYFDPEYYVSFGTNFGNKYQGMNYKYASDAFWGEKIAKHYYMMDKALGFKDRNHYEIALLDPEAVGYYGADKSSPVVYDPETYTYKGLRIPFAVMKEKDEFYQLRLPLALNDNHEMDSYEVMGPTDVFHVDRSDVIIIN